MKTFRHSLIYVMIAATAVCLLGASCGREEETRLNTSAVTYNDELVFSFTLEEFIHKYNSLYTGSHNEDYLRPEAQWEQFVCDDSPFSERSSRYCRFSYDENVLTAPTISVYGPASEKYVHGLTVDFDDHGYSSYLYEVYEEQCFYTLKTLLPDCSDQVITHIYTQLNTLANENVQLEEMNTNTIPDILYYKDSVGIFSYFAIGEYIHICIVPVTQQYLTCLQEQGTEIQSIESLVAG